MNCNVNIFAVDYSEEVISQNCDDAGCEVLEFCQCSLCKCCTVCSEQCYCPRANKELNSVMERILSLGDNNYRFLELFSVFCMRHFFTDWSASILLFKLKVMAAAAAVMWRLRKRMNILNKTSLNNFVVFRILSVDV